MHITEKGRIPSSEAGPKTCGKSLHHHNKWAAWTVEYPDGEVRHYCMWCFLGICLKLPTGSKVSALIPKPPNR